MGPSTGGEDAGKKVRERAPAIVFVVLGRWRMILTVLAVLVVVGLAAVAWATVPALYPLPAGPVETPDVAATDRATRTQAVVTTRASVLAALAGLGALITIAINYRNSRTHAAALAEAARSYAAAEADRARDIAQREAAARDVGEDARERRVTELYARAADQLGSEKAPVRLAGLYALERLAQQTVDQRQTITNVLCAYLRMPFLAPPRAGTDATPDQETAAVHAREEREVRLTAQRILAAHMRPDDTKPPLATYWGKLDLDLTGALLFDLDLSSCALGRV